MKNPVATRVRNDYLSVGLHQRGDPIAVQEKFVLVRPQLASGRQELRRQTQDG